MFVVLFVALPLFGPVLELLIEGMIGPGVWGRALFLSATAVALISLAVATFRSADLYASLIPAGHRNPDPRRRLVVLGPARGPEESLVAACARAGSRWELLCAVSERVAAERTARPVEVILRAMEWHRERLDEVVILLSVDGLTADPAGKERLVALLERWIELASQEGGNFVSVRFELAGLSGDVEATWRLVDRLHDERGDSDVIYDFTGATKPMAIGMALACLDDRYDLQYFLQLPDPDARATAIRAATQHLEARGRSASALASDPFAVGWGLLPVERERGLRLAQGGLLPLVIRTRADLVASRLGV